MSSITELSWYLKILSRDIKHSVPSSSGFPLCPFSQLVPKFWKITWSTMRSALSFWGIYPCLHLLKCHGPTTVHGHCQPSTMTHRTSRFQVLPTFGLQTYRGFCCPVLPASSQRPHHPLTWLFSSSLASPPGQRDSFFNHWNSKSLLLHLMHSSKYVLFGINFGLWFLQHLAFWDWKAFPLKLLPHYIFTKSIWNSKAKNWHYLHHSTPRALIL